MKILKRIFNLFKETNGALSKPVLSKRNHPFTCQLCRCPITNLVKNSYFISDIIPIFFTIRHTFTALFLSNTKARPPLGPTALRKFFYFLSIQDINPLSPKSDQHQIKQSGHESHGNDHTR